MPETRYLPGFQPPSKHYHSIKLHGFSPKPSCSLITLLFYSCRESERWATIARPGELTQRYLGAGIV